MNILVIGSEDNLDECRLKFGERHHYFRASGKASVGLDVVFDFMMDRQAPDIKEHRSPVFFDTSKISLKGISVLVPKLPPISFGFAGLPTFLNRPLLEASLLSSDQVDTLAALCGRLGTPFQIVEDRPGLVTPRIICMIINEAYFAVQDGTASREDIDTAMKLGTAYPYGPFEWCRMIGTRNVSELLEAVYRETGDERYRVCDLLRKES